MQKVYALLQRRALRLAERGGPHIAMSASDTDPGNGPVGFSKYDKNEGGSNVLRMLKRILKDSKKMEEDAIVAEEDAQEAYEDFMKESNAAITQSTEKIVNMKGSNAKAN